MHQQGPYRHPSPMKSLPQGDKRKVQWWKLFRKNSIKKIAIPWFNMATENKVRRLQLSLSLPHSLNRKWRSICIFHLLHLQLLLVLTHSLFLLHFARPLAMKFMWNQPESFLWCQLATWKVPNYSLNYTFSIHKNFKLQ